MGYKLSRGETMQSQVTVHDITLLERPLPKDEDDPKYKDGSMTCLPEVYDECMYGTLARIMRENTEDNCTIPFIRNNTKICTKPKDINTAFWIAWSRITNQKNDCNRPCHSLMVSLGAKNYDKKNILDQNYASVTIYYAPMVTQSSEHWVYTVLVLFGEIGGYVGLILGYSLFNLASWIIDFFKQWAKEKEKKNIGLMKIHKSPEQTNRMALWGTAFTKV